MIYEIFNKFRNLGPIRLSIEAHGVMRERAIMIQGVVERAVWVKGRAAEQGHVLFSGTRFEEKEDSLAYDETYVKRLARREGPPQGRSCREEQKEGSRPRFAAERRRYASQVT